MQLNSLFIKVVGVLLTVLIGSAFGTVWWLGKMDTDWQQWRLAIRNFNEISPVIQQQIQRHETMIAVNEQRIKDAERNIDINKDQIKIAGEWINYYRSRESKPAHYEF